VNFHSAAAKLTTWYLAIVMALSIGLSVALYDVSTRDLTNNIRRQNNFFNFLTPQDLRNLNDERRGQIDDAQSHLRDRLIFFNVVVFLVGGGLSYMLARRTLEPIEETLESQGRFTGDAAHELRTPLTAMQTEIEVALRQKNLSKDQAVKQLRSNLEEVAKLRALSDGLLALVNDRNDEDYRANVKLKKITEQALAATETAAKAKKIKVETELADITLKGNQPQLINLLTILIDNAVKYSPEGTTVRISGEKRDKSARVAVTDQGVGIKQTEINNIFDRFYRADNSRSKIQAEGYGLGLAIAKQIVERHHGYIDVKSQPDKGSTFSVTLPLAR
jgi:two-component system sensor histidine kinase CiaH